MPLRTTSLSGFSPSINLPYFINANAGSLSASAGSLTWSHTTTIDTKCLVVGTFCQNNGNSITMNTVTYNGIALTQIQSSIANGGNGSMWVLFNPPIGTYNIVITPTATADRGIAGSSMNIGNVSSVVISGETDNASTDPMTTTITNLTEGIAIGNKVITGLNATLFAVTQTSPTGIVQAHTPSSFTSNGFAKWQALFYSPNLVYSGSVSFTCDVTSGSISTTNQQFMILQN